jgi:hypothetical protein
MRARASGKRRWASRAALDGPTDGGSTTSTVSCASYVGLLRYRTRPDFSLPRIDSSNHRKGSSCSKNSSSERPSLADWPRWQQSLAAAIARPKLLHSEMCVRRQRGRLDLRFHGMTLLPGPRRRGAERSTVERPRELILSVEVSHLLWRPVRLPRR